METLKQTCETALAAHKAAPKNAALEAAYKAAYAAYRATKPVAVVVAPVELTEAEKARLIGRPAKIATARATFTENTIIDGVLYAAGSPFRLPKGWDAATGPHSKNGAWQ